MTPQFVDFNGDGIEDIITATFEGVAWVVTGTKSGFEQPQRIVDAKNRPILISLYWDEKAEDYANANRAPKGESHPEDHCTSAAAVDWDNDGDMDLLLGSHEGNLFLRRNNGTATEHRFALTNERVTAGGGYLTVPKGMTTPRVADWNGDGKFDLICGGVAGGVYYFQNNGSAERPEFAAAETLIPVPPLNTPTGSQQPYGPSNSFHPEVIDYDNDGDLDLLVGGRTQWHSKSPRKLTAADKRKERALQKAMERLWDKQDKLFGDGDLTDAEAEKIMSRPAFQALEKEFIKIEEQLQEYSTDPDKSADYVWLYRRK